MLGDAVAGPLHRATVLALCQGNVMTRQRSSKFASMSKLSIIATLTAAEGKADELEAALTALIAAADEEPGLEIYSVHRDPKDENAFYFFELYTDQAAFDVHGKGEKMKAAMGSMGGLLGGRPDVKILTPGAAKGLDL